MRSKRFILLMSVAGLYLSCGGSDISSEEIVSSKQFNPEPNIPLECYTDTGVVRYGSAVANPCYVCHTSANTPYANELDDYQLTLEYAFPEAIRELGNPWLNAVAPELTIGSIPKPSDAEVKKWIRTDNWSEAYSNRGKGQLKYFPDVPPIYAYDASGYRLINVDSEGFIKVGQEYTGWRAFKWKPFPGFFPTNGRIDSTFIRLPAKFRSSGGRFNLETYKRNLAILECAVKGISPGQMCSGTEVGSFVMPERYEGDANDVEVVALQYPPGTEFAHPVYYLDPENTISFKSLRLKEMRYMRKLAYAPVREGSGEEEEEEGEFFWDEGRFFNGSGYWEMSAFIEDEKGRLRPQEPEEAKFCIGCHGGVGGSVDGTFTFWRKVPGREGWIDQDYNLTQASIKDWSYRDVSCEGLTAVKMGKEIGNILRAFCGGSKPGEYQLYFSMTNGGDHFRSNREILSRISKDTNKISFLLSPDENIINEPSLLNYLDTEGYITPDLFLPSESRAYSINKEYFRVVKAQAFIYGRDVFGKAFGVSRGGNSVESLSGVSSTGVAERDIFLVIKTLLSPY